MNKMKIPLICKIKSSIIIPVKTKLTGTHKQEDTYPKCSLKLPRPYEISKCYDCPLRKQPTQKTKE